MRSPGIIVVAAVFVSSLAFATTMDMQLRASGPITTWGPSLHATDNSPPRDGQPASYTLEDYGYVTPVKNQGSCGSCWAFATYGSMESNILMHSIGAEDNLSEQHLIEYHGYEWGECDGGNIWMSAAYMSRLDGPVAETDYPYSYSSDASPPGGYDLQYWLDDMSIYDTETEMKNAIMSRGGLYTSLYWAESYYDESDYTYYYDGSAGTNHGVTIVGWDDSKSTAGGTGAWRIKNSWGDTFWGKPSDSGYFWLAYQDSRGGNSGTSFEARTTDALLGAYQHDDFGRVNEVNAPYALNYFSSADLGGPLGAIGFHTTTDSVDYTVDIYDTFASSPSDLLGTYTGTIDYEGWHVVDLDPWIYLPDQDFAVSVYLSDGYQSGGDTWYHAVEQDANDAQGDPYCDSTSQPGQSYYSFDGSAWGDLYYGLDDSSNFAIKGYTTPEPATVLLMALALTILALWCWRRKQDEAEQQP